MLTAEQHLASESVWRTAARSPFKTPPTPDQTLVDLAIVGAGLTGLSAAYHMLAAHPRAKVVVLEASQVGHGASTRNTGMLTPGVGQNLAALVSKFGAEKAADMYRASLDAVRYVQELTTRENIDASLHLTGQLIFARGRSGRSRLARQAGLMETLGLPCERLDTKTLANKLRLGGLSPANDATGPAALRLPTAGTLHPGKLVAGLAAAVRRRRGTIEENIRVQALRGGEQSGGPFAELQLADGRTLRARNVVLATSGYSAPLGVQRGRLLPLHLRVMLTDPLTPKQLAGLGWKDREGAIDSRRVFNYFRLTDDNRILFGGGRPRYRWGGDPSDQPGEDADLLRLASELHELFPSLAGLGVSRSWTGAIAYSLDGLPAIGPVPGKERIWFVGGWCGHGVALSVSSGRWIEERLSRPADGEPAEAMPWFRSRLPAVPTEAARWLGIRAGGWAMELLDRV